MEELIQIDDNKYEFLSDSGKVYTLKVLASGIKCNCLGFKHRQDCRHIKFIDNPPKVRYPRQSALEVINNIRWALHETKYDIAGSYRRLKQDIGDVDILVNCTVEQFSKLLLRLQTIQNKELIMAGSEIIRGTTETNYGKIQFDITRVNKDEWASYLLYRTGPKELNIMMRTKAKLLSYKLNEHGLWLDGEKIKTDTEADIFAELDMEYILPENR